MPTRTVFSIFSLVLALGPPVPLAAQARDTSAVPGFDGNVRWGATREQVNAFWREQPLSEKRERDVAALTYAPWQQMNWTAMVHDQRGLIGLQAVLLPNLAPQVCERVFEGLVAAMRKSFPAVFPSGGVQKAPADALCPAVAAGRAQAEYTWRSAETGVEARAWVGRADGLVHLRMGTPFYQRWASGEVPVRNAGVTMAGFRGIRPAMTYDEVVEVIGRPGTRASSSGAPGGAMETFEWKTSPTQYISVTFAQGRAIMSMQLGLHNRERATPVTLAQFNRLRQGMTYDEAVAALGSQGAYGGFTGSGATVSETYVWWGRAPVSMAQVSFNQGKVTSFHQSGLN